MELDAPTIRLVARIRAIAEQAITDRLRGGVEAPRSAAERSILEVQCDPDHQGAVILHVNSGGNAIACTYALRRAGYRVEHTDYDPFAKGHYGVQLRISIEEEPAADGAA